MQEFEINKVQMIIREFGDEVCDILGDAEACQRWLKDFHDGLLYRRAGRSPFADKLLAEAAAFGKMKRLAGQKGGFAKAARKQKNLEVLVNPTLPGTADGNAAAVTNEADTAPAGQCFKARQGLPGARLVGAPGAEGRPKIPTLEDLYAFASDACLHEMLCREWWEMTYGDRAGLDRDGSPIRNWKAACRAYVKKRISNMENER